MNTLESRLRSLGFDVLHGDIKSKKKDDIIDIAKELARCADELFKTIDQVVEKHLDDKHKSQQLKIDNLKQTAESLIAENIQLKDELKKYKDRNPNWGGKRANAGRPKTNIKRTSHKVYCSSREAEVLKEYGKKKAEGKDVNTLSLWYKYESISDFDVRTRYLYLSKEEWDIVKPEYQKYLVRIKK